MLQKYLTRDIKNRLNTIKGQLEGIIKKAEATTTVAITTTPPSCCKKK